jgi:hypothetical protein
MAKQWALLIGINQYKALQPLMYAQADAVALRNFFVDELGVPVEHCTLLTDVSAAIEPHAYAPLKTEIESQLQTLCRDKVQPGDTLWVFFSGCGLAEAGQDYWMTLDSEPLHLSETAIALTDIFDLLNQARTDQILLVMDMNRNQGAIGHRQIGAQTLTLANDFGIPTLLSCQPDEYSHETMYVRHGLFTKALLEGLRYHGCVTVSQLAAYLGDRVPELCEHHCRPPQHPAVVIPAAQKFLMVVPAEGIANLSVTEADAPNLGGVLPDEPVRETTLPPIPPLPPPNPAIQNSPALPDKGLDVDDLLAIEDQPPSVPPTPVDRRPEPEGLPVDQPDSSRGGALVPQPASEETDRDGEGAFGGIWKWGLLAAAIAFLAGVFLRYQPGWFGGTDQADQPDTPAETAPDAGTTDTETGAETAAEGTEGATTDAEGTDATAAAPQTAEGEPLFPAEVDPIEAGQTALQRAEEAIAANRYGEARAWLTQVPPELQDNRYESLLQQANSEVAEAAVRNQSILNSARQMIQPASASMFNDAIEQARQVPPEDPYYEQAQADIARWSQVILDLAEGRAASGDINGAIAAARLVPDDQPPVTELAQQRIAAWERQIANQELIRQTQNSLQPGQASSFNDAIRALEQITPDQPGYDTARERINQWSEDILAIARARAAQGDLGGAIAAAELVPPSTSAHEQARQEIQRWQEQL